MTEITQDDILHTAADLADKAQKRLGFHDEQWEIVYTKIINVLNEIFENPDFSNYN